MHLDDHGRRIDLIGEREEKGQPGDHDEERGAQKHDKKCGEQDQKRHTSPLKEEDRKERRKNLRVMTARVTGRMMSGTHTGTPRKVTSPDRASFLINFRAPYVKRPQTTAETMFVARTTHSFPAAGTHRERMSMLICFSLPGGQGRTDEPDPEYQVSHEGIAPGEPG